MNCFDRYPVLKINSVPLDLDHLSKNKSILQHSPGQEASTKVTHNISSRLCHSISVVLHIDIAKDVKVTKPSVWTRLCAAHINSRSACNRFGTSNPLPFHCPGSLSIRASPYRLITFPSFTIQPHSWSVTTSPGPRSTFFIWTCPVSPSGAKIGPTSVKALCPPFSQYPSKLVDQLPKKGFREASKIHRYQGQR